MKLPGTPPDWESGPNTLPGEVDGEGEAGVEGLMMGGKLEGPSPELPQDFALHPSPFHAPRARAESDRGRGADLIRVGVPSTGRGGEARGELQRAGNLKVRAA